MKKVIMSYTDEHKVLEFHPIDANDPHPILSFVNFGGNTHRGWEEVTNVLNADDMRILAANLMRKADELEAHYEARQATKLDREPVEDGVPMNYDWEEPQYEDYEPSPYDGTYSEC